MRRREDGLARLDGGPGDETAVGITQGRFHHARVQAVDRAHGERREERRGRIQGHRLGGRVPALGAVTAGEDARDAHGGTLGEIGGEGPQRIVFGVHRDQVPVLQLQAEAGHGGDAAAKGHAAHPQPAARARALKAAEERRKRAFRQRSP